MKVTPVDMARPTKEKQFILDKYKELVWALSAQDYSLEEIGAIMGRDKSTIYGVVLQKPKGWTTPWRKMLKDSV